MPTRLWSVVFDANDVHGLATFWSEALGWKLKHGDGYSTVSRGGGFLPRIEFVPVPEPKTSKNRIHFDLAAEDATERDQIAQRLIGLGASNVDIGQPEDAYWTVLTDPEGNEMCISPGSRRYAGDCPIYAIAYDALDGASLGRFWQAATGWYIVRETPRTHDGDGKAWGPTVVLQSPNGVGPIITVSGPPERVAAKPVKNRLHLDVAPFTVDDQTAEVERLVALGARRIDIGQGEVPWVVMADPEGNEFCVLTPR